MCTLTFSLRRARTRKLTVRLAVVIAFREFSIITDDTIASERKRFRSEVLVSIETFAKRTAIRNLQSTGRLDNSQLGLAYDHFQLAVLQMKERERQAKAANGSRSRSSSTVGRSPARSPRPDGGASSLSSGSKPPKEETKPEDRLDRIAFSRFMADVATWARNEKLVKNGLLSHIEREPADHALIDKIYLAWDVTHAGSLSFQVCLCAARSQISVGLWRSLRRTSSLASTLSSSTT